MGSQQSRHADQPSAQTAAELAKTPGALGGDHHQVPAGIGQVVPGRPTVVNENLVFRSGSAAFFVAPADVQTVCARSDNLRALFEKFPQLSEAYLVLGMAFAEQRGFGLALHGEVVQRDVAQTTVNFPDHKTRLCASDEASLRRVVGVEVFEYLISRALLQIGAERVERQELQASRSLIRARLRLLQQHGPGLASMLGEAPAGQSAGPTGGATARERAATGDDGRR